MIKNGVTIHYLAHQILTNKNSPSKMNHQLRKMETTPNQTQQNQWTNLCWSEISLRENWDPSKITKDKSKPGWEFRLEPQIKKLTKIIESDKTKKKKTLEWIGTGKKRRHRKKTYDITWGNIPESNGKKRKIEEISTKSKTIQTK